MRQTFIYVEGRGLVQVERKPRERKAPAIISDSTPGVEWKSMADGKVYDSKSAYRRELKARGYEELGGCSRESYQEPDLPTRPDVGKDLVETAQHLGMSL